MADWSIVNLTTAAVGIATTINYQVQFSDSSTQGYTQTVTNGTVNVTGATNSNFNIFSDTTFAVPARRPGTGQVFPRGVYNK